MLFGRALLLASDAEPAERMLLQATESCRPIRWPSTIWPTPRSAARTSPSRGRLCSTTCALTGEDPRCAPAALGWPSASAISRCAMRRLSRVAATWYNGRAPAALGRRRPSSSGSPRALARRAAASPIDAAR